MCTLSVHHSPGEILVTMNRDEALSRAPEAPPRKFVANAESHRAKNGVAWVAPIDGEKGGTWMGANDRGVVACLLNFYMPGESLLPDHSGQYNSRGEIIPFALAHGAMNAVLAALLENLDPARYPSFDLHLIAPEGVRRVMWKSRPPLESREIAGEWNVYSSSGWDSAEIIRWRESKFTDWLKHGGKRRGPLPAFHLCQEAGHEDRSPLMKRDWSSTRSVTQVQFDPRNGDIVMRYWPNPQPDSAEPDVTITLQRAHQSVAKAKAVRP